MSTARISLPDRYRVVRHIANGGMASVWEAHDEVLDRAVAVKLLASHLSEDDRARQRFQREARAAAAVSNHPNVVTIYDVGEHDGRTFMVMELLTGGTVADKLRAGDRISPRTAMRWLRDAASALDAAHAADVVHRDVKPANMLLDDGGRLAIADFGIARLALEDQLTATGTVLGTAAYISPEQAVGDPATAASDRYALAVVAYELLTGARPFEAENFAAQARAHVEDDPEPASDAQPRPAARGRRACSARGLEKDPERPLRQRRRVRRPPRRRDLRPARHPTDHAQHACARRRPAAPHRARRAAAGRRGARPPRRNARRAAGRARRRRADRRDRRAAALRAATAAAATTRRPRAPPSAPRRRTKTQTPEQDRDRDAGADRRPETATPEATETPAPSGEADLDKARQLQVEGYNARQAGDYAKALDLSQQALDACGNSNELDPCGYALFEKGLALNRSGQPDEAIPVLEERLDRFGDNAKGEVEKELKAAQEGGRRAEPSTASPPRSPACRSCPPSRAGSSTTTCAPPAPPRCSSSAPRTASAPPTWPPRWPTTAPGG